jgi:glycosyltransferase involved in cell wall biosynthesis
MPAVCLVIPCFNEANRLPVEKVLAYLTTSRHVSICFVNDGSTDGTPSLLQSIQRRNPAQVLVLDLPVNGGKAEAVRKGMLHAAADGRFSVLGYWDADLSTPLDAVGDLLAVLESNPACQLILGSRVKRLGSRVERRLVRHLTGRVFATFASLILRLPVYDSQCGAKLVRAEAVPGLFAEPFVTKWLFDVELLARLRNALGIEACVVAAHEVPLRVWVEVGGSKLRLSHLMRVPSDLLRIHRRYNGVTF